MDCFNYNCPFRSDTTSSSKGLNFVMIVSARCECIACPNRCKASTAYASNHTLPDDEFAKLRANASHDSSYGIGNGC